MGNLAISAMSYTYLDSIIAGLRSRLDAMWKTYHSLRSALEAGRSFSPGTTKHVHGGIIDRKIALIGAVLQECFF